MLKKSIYIFCLLFSSCGFVFKELGVYGTTTATETTYSTYEVIDAIKTGADVVVYTETGKTTTDHVLSEVTQKDCHLFDCKDRPLQQTFVKQKRVTGEACWGRMYSDWPCMEAEGCIILDAR